ADQIVTGTAINLLALGVTGFVYRELQRTAMFAQAAPRLARDAVVPFAWIVAPAALAFVVWRTAFGLRLRASGENPAALRAAGERTRRAVPSAARAAVRGDAADPLRDRRTGPGARSAGAVTQKGGAAAWGPPLHRITDIVIASSIEFIEIAAMLFRQIDSL